MNILYLLPCLWSLYYLRPLSILSPSTVQWKKCVSSFLSLSFHFPGNIIILLSICICSSCITKWSRIFFSFIIILLLSCGLNTYLFIIPPLPPLRIFCLPFPLFFIIHDFFLNFTLNFNFCGIANWELIRHLEI